MRPYKKTRKGVTCEETRMKVLGQGMRKEGGPMRGSQEGISGSKSRRRFFGKRSRRFCEEFY